VLLGDLENWNASFWKNENAGESRIKFFITLVTTVTAGLEALHQYGRPVPGLAPVALVGLLLFGFVTFTRMVRRNQVTDEYKEWGAEIRRQLLGDTLFESIYGLERQQPSLRGLWNGGLATMMLFMNAMLAAALIGVLATHAEVAAPWLFGAIAFACAVWAQRMFMIARHDAASRAYARREAVRRAAGSRA
jgi:hypothetical protein